MPKSRIEEFGLRRAVGRPRLLLAGIVLAETLFVGLFTAIVVGIAGLKLGARILGGYEPFLRHVSFPWQTGVAGGLIPAVRAARIPIATVMRG